MRKWEELEPVDYPRLAQEFIDGTEGTPFGTQHEFNLYYDKLDAFAKNQSFSKGEHREFLLCVNDILGDME